jgi:Zn-dependent peptidase ImmA (M78 family)
VILISDRAFAARARFDLAHEFGHILLHKALTNAELEAKGTLALVEHQAHHFASCFLMPEATFAKEIYGVDEGSLIATKQRWGVSMQAIIMRLNEIGLLSDYQKVRAFQQISAKGQRKKEPLDGVVPPERGRLLKKAIEFLKETGVLEIPDFFERARYPQWFLEAVTGLKNAVVATSNVVQFRLKPERI